MAKSEFFDCKWQMLNLNLLLRNNWYQGLQCHQVFPPSLFHVGCLFLHISFMIIYLCFLWVYILTGLDQNRRIFSSTSHVKKELPGKDSDWSLRGLFFLFDQSPKHMSRGWDPLAKESLGCWANKACDLKPKQGLTILFPLTSSSLIKNP